jgi:hypothetical protein
MAHGFQIPHVRCLEEQPLLHRAWGAQIDAMAKQHRETVGKLRKPRGKDEV